jgi:hypothetical protein
MTSQDLPEQARSCTRKFSLNAPPRGKQFRVELAKALAAERRAARKLTQALDARAGAPLTVEAVARGPRVNPLELMRAWPSPGILNLRRDLDAQAEEQLRNRLEALLAGELGEETWLKIVSVITEARRAADRLDEMRPRKWMQTFNAPDEW